MNKSIIMLLMVIFGAAGEFFPYLFGEKDLFSLWCIAGSVVGGLFGVWIGVVISRAMS